jgi:hypothetical protein
VSALSVFVLFFCFFRLSFVCVYLFCVNRCPLFVFRSLVGSIIVVWWCVYCPHSCSCGPDESGQVTSSANVLMKELTESVSVLRRAALKRRVKRTNKQTVQLRRVIAAWQAAREKQSI